jgi:membrane protein
MTAHVRFQSAKSSRGAPPAKHTRPRLSLHRPGTLWQLLKLTVTKWNDHHVLRFGAALAYYTAFAVVPLSVITIEVATVILGYEKAEGLLLGQVEGVIGEQGAKAIGGMLKDWLHTGSWLGPTVVACLVLFFAAANAFDQLQDALNAIWGVEPKPQESFVGKLRQRFVSVQGLLGTAFLLVVSLTVNAALVGLSEASASGLPESGMFRTILRWLMGFAVMTLLYALIFKLLPKAKVAWSDVWIGAIVTAALFSLGKWAVMLFLGNSAMVSSYGPAGSFIVILLWALYSSQILLFGAEFTAIYASACGEGIRPTKDAVAVWGARQNRRGGEMLRRPPHAEDQTITF